VTDPSTALSPSPHYRTPLSVAVDSMRPAVLAATMMTTH
jgi:hypothetical protein